MSHSIATVQVVTADGTVHDISNSTFVSLQPSPGRCENTLYILSVSPYKLAELPKPAQFIITLKKDME